MIPMKTIVLSAAATALAMGLPAMAQDVEGDAQSPTAQWGRMMAPEGSFWLDSNDDTELIRYTTPRDVGLCLPKPTGVGAAGQGYPLQITWDNQYTVTLRPGNCFYFDAKTVKVKPAEPLPSGVTLSGRVSTERALQRGN